MLKTPILKLLTNIYIYNIELKKADIQFYLKQLGNEINSVAKY